MVQLGKYFVQLISVVSMARVKLYENDLALKLECVLVLELQELRREFTANISAGICNCHTSSTENICIQN